jgi:hypothetical protein
MAIAPNAGKRARRVDEGIVLGNRTIVVQAVDLAQRRGQVLRHLHVVRSPIRPEEVTLLVEQEARAVMVGSDAEGIAGGLNRTCWFTHSLLALILPRTT